MEKRIESIVRDALLLWKECTKVRGFDQNLLELLHHSTILLNSVSSEASNLLEVEIVVDANKISRALGELKGQVEQISELIRNSDPQPRVAASIKMGRLKALAKRCLNEITAAIDLFNPSLLRKEEITQVELKEKIDAFVYIGLPDEMLEYMDIEILQEALGDFMEVMGFEYKTEDEPVLGSFFQWFKFKSKLKCTQKEASEIYAKGKAALEAKYLNLPTAEGTEKYAKSASDLICALGQVKRAIIRAGAILVVKTTIKDEPYIIVETISPLLAQKMDENPRFLKDPDELIKLIDSLNSYYQMSDAGTQAMVDTSKRISENTNSANENAEAVNPVAS